jgi:hypothetical protein
MTDLTAAKRKKMPKSEFAGKGKSFPINDPTHQRLAISGATRAENAGNISPAEADAIKAKARAKLAKGKKKKPMGKGKLSEAIEMAMGDED